MELGANPAGAYIEPQQKSQNSMMFINKLPKIHQKFVQ